MGGKGRIMRVGGAAGNPVRRGAGTKQEPAPGNKENKQETVRLKLPGDEGGMAESTAIRRSRKAGGRDQHPPTTSRSAQVPKTVS